MPCPDQTPAAQDPRRVGLARRCPRRWCRHSRHPTTSTPGGAITVLMARSHWPECHSVCFPNRTLGVRRANGSYSGSIRYVLGAYGTAFGNSKNVWCIFKIIFIDHPNVASMCIREVFGKHSRSIRHLRKTFGRHASSSWCIRNENVEGAGFRMLSERFQYAFRILQKACGKNSIHSVSIRRVLKAFGKFTESVRKGNLSKSTCGKYSVIHWGKQIRKDIRPV